MISRGEEGGRISTGEGMQSPVGVRTHTTKYHTNSPSKKLKIMATRLYPVTENPEILDSLARVLAGTAKAWQEIQAKFQDERIALHGAFYSAIAAGSTGDEIREEFSQHSEAKRNAEEATDALYAFSHFMLYGWSRITDKTADVITSLGFDTDAGCWDEETAQKHLAENGRPQPVKNYLLTWVKALLAAQGIQLPASVPAESLEGLCWN